MFEEHVLPAVRGARRRTRVVRSRVLRIASMSESDVEQAVAPALHDVQNPRTTILGAPGQVELHLIAEGDGRGRGRGADRGAGRGIREAPARPHLQRGRARAASGRGGAAARARAHARARRVLHRRPARGAAHRGARARAPSSSAATSPTQPRQVELLGVDAALIERHGRRLRGGGAGDGGGRAHARRAPTSASAITGIAGPDGGTPEKPVGLVFIATRRRRRDARPPRHFPGGRERVRFQATQARSRCCGGACWACSRCERGDGRRPRVRRARARRAAARGARRAAAAPAADGSAGPRWCGPRGSTSRCASWARHAEQIEALEPPLAAAARACPPLAARSAALGMFPERGQPARAVAGRGAAAAGPGAAARLRGAARGGRASSARRGRSAPT